MFIIDKGPPKYVAGRPKHCVKIWRVLNARFLRRGERPPNLPKPRSTSSRRGLSYERHLSEELEEYEREGAIQGLLWGPWIEFTEADDSGRIKTHHAQPDFVFEVPNIEIPGKTGPDGKPLRDDVIVVAEAKLTETGEAFEQLKTLYVPLVRKIFPQRRVIGIQICKNITPDSPGTFSNIRTPEPYGVWFYPLMLSRPSAKAVRINNERALAEIQGLGTGQPE